MARVPSHDEEDVQRRAFAGGQNPMKPPKPAPQASFTIVFRPAANGGPTQVQFIPQAVGVPMSPRDVIAMCTEGIRWALAEDAQLAQQHEREEQTGLWVPPGVPRGRGPV